jgi:dTDP-6-deoxy-L-talose 4-dehydrogenase (NAD+)
LVTGANGYIGRYVVKTLLDFGYEVIACDIFTDKIDRRAHIIDNYDIFILKSQITDCQSHYIICLNAS